MGRCCDCEMTKEFIDLGRCPICDASPMLMSTKTHIARCSFCKAEAGVPRALIRLCRDEVSNNRYTIWLSGTVTKEQMLALAKILECTAATVYRRFEYGFARFDDVMIIQAYQIRKLLQDSEAKADITPAIGDYERFEQCWNI